MPVLGTERASGDSKLQTTFKPRDVEEWIDLRVNRPTASQLVRLVAPFPVTPNQLTVFSGISGLSAGVAIATASLDHPWGVPLGGLLLFLSIVLDCADGQLARLRGKSSMVGRALDGYVDVLSAGSVFVGFAVFLYRAGYDPIYINLVGWSSGYSMKWHTHSYDHAKNIYLNNVLPPEQCKSALPTFEEIDAEREARLRAGDRFGALILRGFGHLTRSQRGGWQDTRIGLGLPRPRTEAERDRYRDMFYGVMRLWTWNGLATHLVLLLVATALTPFFRGAALGAEWFILGPMNLMTVYLRSRERRIERDAQALLRPGPSLAA